MPEKYDLPSEAAEARSRLRLDREDLDGIHELVTRNQDDAPTPAERSDLESYLRVSSFADLMHAKARRFGTMGGWSVARAGNHTAF
jgi:hypothetical protein